MSEKSAGDAIRQSEAQFRCIVESAQEYGIFTADLQGRVTTWNIGAERCFGHAEAEILGQTMSVVFTEEDRARGVPEQEMRSALATGRAKDIRWHLRKDGSRFWADGYLMQLQDDGGQAIGFVKIVRDRTDEKMAESRFQESQEQFRLMVESATDYVIFTTDRENRITTWNTGAERVLGYFEPEALGQDARIIFTPEDRAAGRPEQEIDTALSVGRAESERWHERKDGTRFWGSGQMMLLRNHQGDTRGFVKIFRDKTDQKLAEAEAQRLLRVLETERGQLDEVFQNSPAFMVVVRGPDHVIELVNEQYNKLVGHRNLLGKPIREAFPDLEGQGFYELLDLVYRTGEPFIATEKGVVLHGPPGHAMQERILDFVYQPIREPEGEVSGILVHGIDLTERKLAEVRLRESEERYRTLFTTMDQGFCVIEMLFGPDDQPIDYRFLEMNPAFEAHTGLRSAAGKTMRELVPDLDGFWFETYGKVALTGESVRFVNSAPALNHRWFDVFAFRIGQPEQRRVAILFSDITDSKRVEQDRERLVMQLQEADVRKNEFLAMLAHELRNPLAGIHSAIRIARRIGQEEQVPYAHEVIERQAKNLSRLIDDLLDVSRITQGKVELRREVVDVPNLVHRAAESVRPLIDQRRHKLAIVHSSAPMWIDADPTRMEQVISNLLTNSAKYSEEGANITVSLDRHAGQVVITVSDTGVGIPPVMLPKVFDLFTQADRSLARSEGGLGIGLTLVKQLVEMHGGTITAKSELGLGSEFTISLTAQDASPITARKRPQTVVPGRGRRVLIVDNNADTARLTARLLQSMEFVVQVVHDGRAALEAARTHCPEAVLLDIGLPGMNGYEVAHQLRQEECCRDSTIIAVSGYGDETSRERGREAGFDHHLVKPVDVEQIIHLISEHERPER